MSTKTSERPRLKDEETTEEDTPMSATGFYTCLHGLAHPHTCTNHWLLHMTAWVSSPTHMYKHMCGDSTYVKKNLPGAFEGTFVISVLDGYDGIPLF